MASPLAPAVAPGLCGLLGSMEGFNCLLTAKMSSGPLKWAPQVSDAGGPAPVNAMEFGSHRLLLARMVRHHEMTAHVC